MSDIANKRSRKWSLTIHENDPALNIAYAFLKSENKAKNDPKIAIIKHDKDINEDGSPKLVHWHCIIEFENARTFQSMKNVFEGAHVEIPNNYDATIQYLIHKNDLNKYQYSESEIETNAQEWLKGHLNCELKKTLEQQEIELIQNILAGKYDSFFDLIVSYDFDMTFLQRRNSVIDELCRGLQLRQTNELIMKNTKPTAGAYENERQLIDEEEESDSDNDNTRV